MENLAQYIIRASFSQERMTYIPEESKVPYQSKDERKENIFEALEWSRRMRDVNTRGHVLTYSEQRGANGLILCILQ